MNAAGPFERAKRWVAAHLGPRYVIVVDIADRAATAFALVVAAKTVGGDLFDVKHILDLSYWEAAAYAGAAAALSTVKSTIMQAITGDTALGSLVSRTLRARRETPKRRPAHRVKVVQPPALDRGGRRR